MLALDALLGEKVGIPLLSFRGLRPADFNVSPIRLRPEGGMIAFSALPPLRRCRIDMSVLLASLA